jgi:hypothetical protein
VPIDLAVLSQLVLVLGGDAKQFGLSSSLKKRSLEKLFEPFEQTLIDIGTSSSA